MKMLREAINPKNDGIASSPLRLDVKPCHANHLVGEVYDRFRQAGYLALRDIMCEVHDGVVFLDGRLNTHHLKQIAQEIAWKVNGISCVVNRIEVITSRPSQSNNASRFGANAPCFDYSIES